MNYNSMELAKRDDKFNSMMHFNIMITIYDIIKKEISKSDFRFTKKSIIHIGNWITPYFEMNEIAYNYLRGILK